MIKFCSSLSVIIAHCKIFQKDCITIDKNTKQREINNVWASDWKYQFIPICLNLFLISHKVVSNVCIKHKCLMSLYYCLIFWTTKEAAIPVRLIPEMLQFGLEHAEKLPAILYRKNCTIMVKEECFEQKICYL